MASRFWKSRVLGVVGTIALCTAALSSALVTSPVSAYGWALTNGDFSAPGTNGSTPTGWSATTFGNDTSPYSLSINEYNSSGQYPPPAPLPGGASWASEAFYDVGSTTGIDGGGGNRRSVGSTRRPPPR